MPQEGRGSVHYWVFRFINDDAELPDCSLLVGCQKSPGRAPLLRTEEGLYVFSPGAFVQQNSARLRQGFASNPPNTPAPVDSEVVVLAFGRRPAQTDAIHLQRLAGRNQPGLA